MVRTWWSFVWIVVWYAGCRPAPVPIIVPPPPPPAAPAAPDTVWTNAEAVVIRMDSAMVALPRPFTRLEVIRGDSSALLVRCTVCGDARAGWVFRNEVVHEPALPHSAAEGSLAEFALAVRNAAVRHDLVELRPVMATDFSFSSIGAYGRDLALSAWISEEYRTLDRVASLLDGGLTPRGEWWVAPPEYEERLGYRGLRLGFKRAPGGRWEWVFLMRGEIE